jgi:proline iminopeptidase
MPATPYHQQHLSLSDNHALYVAQYGNPDAPAAVVLHGGPGSGTSPSVLDWFDLQRQRVVLFDQRGAGQSRPHGDILHNDSHRLVDDLELLRTTLGIERWMVVGGSWGATLALLYAGQHVERVQSLVLRGSFLASPREMQWFFQSLRALVPHAWNNLTTGWRAQQKEQVLQTLCAMLLRGDAQEASEAAQRWSDYEDAIMRAMAGSPQTESRATGKASERTVGKYRLQAHYLSQGCFTSERQLFRMARRLRHVPTILIHGTHDLVCPPENAQRLQRFMPHAECRWIMKGTHTPADAKIAQALKEAVKALA